MDVRKILEKKKIPSLQKKGFLHRRFFANIENKVNRYGSVYSKEGMQGYSFIYLVEEFPQKSSVSGCRTIKTNGTTLHVGHRPEFGFARNNILRSTEETYENLYKITENRFKIAKKLMNERKWDFLMLVETSTDQLAHNMWKFMDPRHEDYERGHKFENAMLNYYKFLDAQIGSFLGNVGGNCSIMLASDHGSSMNKGRIHLNEWLRQEGYLKLKEEPPGSIQLRNAKVDWKDTKAYATGYYGQIYINQKGREPEGVVEKEDKEGLVEEIKRKLRKIKGKNNENLDVKLWRPEEIYQGKYKNSIRAPDLITCFGNYSWNTCNNVGSNSVFCEAEPQSGLHSREGIFSLYDPSIAPKRSRASIKDIAPTVLSKLGVNIPDYMKGNPIDSGRSEKVVLLGLDSADPKILFDRFKNELPNLSELLDKSVYGELESTIPPLTVPAWACMVTGKDPGDLNVFTIRQKKEKSYHDTIAPTSELTKGAIWDVLSENNKFSGVINVPTTYPPKKINGFMITGLFTPDTSSEYTYPKAIKKEINKMGINYQFAGGIRLGENNSFSWKNGNKVHTLIKNPNLDKSFEESFKLFQKPDIFSHIPDLFGLFKYLPEKVENWKVSSVFANYTTHKNHRFRMISGFYRSGEKSLGLDLRFACACSSEFEEGLLPPQEFIEGEDVVEVGEENFNKYDVKNYKGRRRTQLLGFIDKNKKCSILAHNTNSTEDFENYKNEMAKLVKRVMGNLKNYRPVQMCGMAGQPSLIG